MVHANKPLSGSVRTPMKRVLVVDDEQSILQIVSYALSEAGYAVDTAMDGERGETMFSEVKPNIVILDVMLPGKSGLDVARDIRAVSNVPIIMLSAKAEEVDRILGLEFGADDYVTKPFSPRELVSRVRAILRRADIEPDHHERIEIADLAIDTRSRQVRLAGEEVHFTTSEYEILLHLVSQPGKAVSRQSILSALWDEAPVGEERAIDVHIHNMREKLEADPKCPAYILTVRGYGYRFRET
jgi:DNA-binding response OmpR family regulator